MSDLRFLLNIAEEKYKNYPDFKKRVILSSQKELQEKTDISFEFTETRERRKVVKLEFRILSQHSKTQEPKETVSNSLEATLKTKLLLNTKQIQTVSKQFSKEHIERNITYTLKQRNIKNLAGYFMKALEQDF